MSEEQIGLDTQVDAGPGTQQVGQGIVLLEGEDPGPPVVPPVSGGGSSVSAVARLGHLWLYDNLLTDLTVTPSEVAEGRTSGAVKEVAVGGAAGVAQGLYTGLLDRQWVVEIHDTTDGGVIGKAKFRYSINGGQSWAVENLVTQNAPVALQDGVAFFWIPSLTGDDFAVGDRWRFKTTLPFGISPWLDMQDRNRVFRSRDATGAVTFTVQLTTPRLVRAFLLMDHNLTEDATIRVQGNSSLSWVATPIDETINWTSPHLAKIFLGGTYAYWRIEILDANNPARYLELGKPYLGDYVRLVSARRMTYRGTPSGADLPWDDQVQRFGTRAETRLGYRRESVDAVGRRFPLRFTNIGKVNADALSAMRNAVWSRTARQNKPLFFIPEAVAPSSLYLCFLDTFRSFQGPHPSRYDTEMDMMEVVRL